MTIGVQAAAWKSAVRRVYFSMLLLAACGQGPDVPERPGATATRAPLSTPTLKAGLPTSTPGPTRDSIAEAAGPAEAPFGAITPAPTATATHTPTPTATPVPAARLALGQDHLRTEDYASAVVEFQAGLVHAELSEDQRREALFGLGQAHLLEGAYGAAADALGQLLANLASSEVEPAEESLSPGSGTIADVATFLLAEAHRGLGDCTSAIGAYRGYLSVNGDMASYVEPLIADCYSQLGDEEQALLAYEAAVFGDAVSSVKFELHNRLAELYLARGAYGDAKEQYELILSFAKEEDTLGWTFYLAGTAEIMAGNTEVGYEHYLTAVQMYPRSFGSYQALVGLVQAEIGVDDYQRGLVDYHAGAYELAIESFLRYIGANDPHREEAHLYVAWSYEQLGNVPVALNEIEAFIQANTPPEPAAGEDESASTVEEFERGWIEKSELLTRAGRIEESIANYEVFLERFPNSDRSPHAAWRVAELTEFQGNALDAAERYLSMAEQYPDDAAAAEALFRAGYLMWQRGEEEEASTAWRSGAEGYAESEYGAASLVWLLKILPKEEREAVLKMVSQTPAESFYRLRAQHESNEITPFMPAENFAAGRETEAERKAAEGWLVETVELEDDSELASLRQRLAEDGRMVRGTKLWHLGMRAEARREVEELRRAHATDPLASYLLAVEFRELGLFRSSILAASTTMRLLEVTAFDAPSFLAKLAYPAYFAELILKEASGYGYDPALQFALIRQESLFESFATSSAAARGLAQVIPDTGSYIALRLGWPEFEVDDLYHPYVGIAFGAFYLNEQLETFDGDAAAALAAYNGGPGNAARWLSDSPADIDQFLETIDFAETRLYVERIYVGQAIYRFLYG